MDTKAWKCVEMKDRSCWNWMECIFKRIPIPTPVLSLMVGGAVAITYILFITRVEGLAWNNYFGLQVAFLSALIAYLLSMNQYILNDLKTIIRRLEFSPAGESCPRDLYSHLEMNFKSRQFFFLLGIMILPHIIIDLLRVYVMQSVPYEEIFFSNPLFNLYNYLITFLAYYLLAYLFWIMINTKWILDKLAESPYQDLIKIDLFHADRIGGLGHIKDFIMKLNIYFSIGISLAILAYIDMPTGFSLVVIYDVAILILFLLAGFVLLFSALDSLKEIFKKRMNEEIYRIDEKHQEGLFKLFKISSGEGKEKDNELKFLSDSVEMFHKERDERIKVLQDFETRYNLKPAISAFISFVMPLLALYEKINGFGITKILIDAFSPAADGSTLASLWLQIIGVLHP